MVVSENNHVSVAYKRIAGKIQIVCHSVAAKGDYNNPNKVYLFEAAIKGPYFKYCNNVDFDIATSEPETDFQM
ncbi:hypothetical protein MJO29_016337 [Puccinia striiformis f. sp. tritici]|uniref:Alpha-type protein kinase domain-containing protein n=1 Tax=Puccinia striiformis TaxID=27350 RepID=A0A2S4UL41_9BASI|nr:hypothetical protein MJO29_016337 [Puccinia striiformis f. sp. tritici]POV97999.1 hypothetical protein PSHT_14273 [Puccinia striiformis]